VKGIILASWRFPLIPGRPFAESFAAIPPAFASYLRQGFVILSNVAPKHYGLLTKRIVEAIDYPSLHAEEKFAAEFGVKEEDISPLVAAVSLVCVTLSATEETPESLVNAALGAKIVSDANKNALLEFSKVVAQTRSHMKEDLERSRMAARVLPALTDFESVVDARPSFKKDEIIFSVPVVLVHIDTDATQQEMWFQMSKNQLKFIIERLQEAFRRIELVEAWALLRLPPSKPR